MSTVETILFVIVFPMIFGSFIYTNLTMKGIYSKYDKEHRDTGGIITIQFQRVLDKIEELTKLVYERTSKPLQ